MFIARISRGRSIRTFVTGVLIVPSLVSLVWFAVFGGAAIHQQRLTEDLVGEEGAVNSNSALFSLLDHYPIATITSVLVIILVGIFFVSGADAASMVMGTLSEKGSIEPSRPSVVFWGALTGAVAAIMLVVGDGDEALTGLQQITIVAAVPFVLIMGVLCVSLYKDLQTDPMVVRDRLGTEAVESAVVTGVQEHQGQFALVVEKSDGGDPVRIEELPPTDPVVDPEGRKDQ
jgi:choline-glycine betaine transporter